MANAKVEKLWGPAIRKAVHEYGEVTDENGVVKKARYINILALQLVKSAAGGDIQALKEVGDRLDGKAPQALTGGDGGAIKVEATWLPPSE